MHPIRCRSPVSCRIGAVVALVLALPDLGSAQDRAGARDAMIETIRLHERLAAPAIEDGQIPDDVIAAMREVPRHEFVPNDQAPYAYDDRPLPIGYGQTISQPFIVALMSHLADIEPGDKVYELGTGSGYQAAVLAEIGAEVYSVEIVPELAERAAETLAALGYDDVHVRAGDGYQGWPSAAPFDAMVVTAAGPEIPQPLIDQLEPGGRLVMPVGGVDEIQQLVVLVKQSDGTLERRSLLPVRFVPITGDGGR